jgi:uncharacterized protein YegJ (DUF2314 family)
MQIPPVSSNHCRVGHSLALAISSKLSNEEFDLPCDIKITLQDLESMGGFENRYSKDEISKEGIVVHLKLDQALSEGDEEEFMDEDVEFITVSPPASFEGGYDQWVYETSKALGFNPPRPNTMDSYDAALEEAVMDTQSKLSSIRERFVSGLNGLNLGLKIGLDTSAGGKEFVWVRPIKWDDNKSLKVVLECQPYDCDGYNYGDELEINESDITDYGIGSEEAGLVEHGASQQVAEDYGLILP